MHKKDSIKNSIHNKINRSKKPPHIRVGMCVAYCIWVITVFVAVNYIISAIIGLIVRSGHGDWLGNANVAQTLASVFIYVVTITIAIYFPYKLFHDKTEIKDLGLKRKLPNWVDIGLAPIAYFTSLLCIFGVMYLIKQFIPGFNLEQRQQVGFNPSTITTQFELILVYFTLAVLAPVAEETLFRGYLFGKIRRYFSVVPTVFITAFIFSVMHLGVGFLTDLQWNVALATFVLGITLGWLRAATDNLWASIVLHMLQNTVAFLLLFAVPFTVGR